jgi:hypothetical protein
VKEKIIDSNELMASLDAVLDEIRDKGTVFIVDVVKADWKSDRRFVLGPESICGRVFGLVDPEYGWPKIIEIDTISDISDVCPETRRHPCLCHGNNCCAVGIRMTEYEMIKKKFFHAST